MSAPKQPQDRKPKAAKKTAPKRPAAKAIAAEAGGSEPFTFDHDGTTYELPSPDEAAGRIPGRFIRDAVMNGDDASDLRLAFATLEAAGADDAALDALYEKPHPDMLDILSRWMQGSVGATQGESSSSST